MQQLRRCPELYGDYVLDSSCECGCCAKTRQLAAEAHLNTQGSRGGVTGLCCARGSWLGACTAAQHSAYLQTRLLLLCCLGADEHYCGDMAKNGTWGDNVTLQVRPGVSQYHAV